MHADLLLSIPKTRLIVYLTTLRCAHTACAESIPEGIGGLTEVAYIFLDSNQLTGDDIVPALTLLSKRVLPMRGNHSEYGKTICTMRVPFIG